MAAKEAVDFIGMPEGNLALAQAVVYLSLAPKSNALYTAYGAVQADGEHTVADSVPLHLRNAPTKLMKNIGYGKGYQYSHDSPGHFNEQELLPEGLIGTTFYTPGDNRKELEFAAYLDRVWGTKYHGGDGG